MTAPHHSAWAPTPTEPALLSADAAGAWLGLSRSSVFRLVREGRLRACRPFRELRFRVTDLTEIVATLETVELQEEASAEGQSPAEAAREARDVSATPTS